MKGDAGDAPINERLAQERRCRRRGPVLAQHLGSRVGLACFGLGIGSFVSSQFSQFSSCHLINQSVQF